MEIEPEILQVFRNTNGLNEYHLALYLLMRRMSHNGQKPFAIRSALLAKRFDHDKSIVRDSHRWRKRKRRLLKLGLIEIDHIEKDGLPVYRVPVPFR